MFSIKRNENTRISTIFQPIKSNQNKKINNIMQNLQESKNMNNDEEENGLEYMTFIDRGKMDEKQLIAFYKKARRRVCLKLDEIENTTNFGNRNYETYKDSKNFRIFIKNQNKSKKKFKNFNNTDTNFFKKKNLNLRTKKPNSSLLLDNNENQKKMNTLNMEIAYQNLMKNAPPAINNKSLSYIKTQPNIPKNKKYIFRNNDNNKEVNENEDSNFFYNNRNNARNRIKELQEKWKEYDQLSPEQRQRREFLESKKKWMSKEDFHRVFGLHTTAIKPIPNVMSYGKPVTDYKFREINHEKWITPNGFV